MRLLLDSNCPFSLRGKLLELGHSIEDVCDWPADPGDHAIIHYAHVNRLVVITFDREFTTGIALDLIKEHSGILRVSGGRAGSLAAACQSLLRRYGPLLEEGYVVIDDGAKQRVMVPYRLRQLAPEDGR